MENTYMKDKHALSNLSAARVVASIFGVLGGLGGLTHGVGETLQGNVRPDGLFIYSWTQGPIATNMGGEPGITIVPNMLVTGILTIIFSLTIIVWSVAFVQRKNGGLIQILLFIALLLVGGGVGPIVIGVLAGVAGLGIDAPYPRWRARLSDGLRRVLAALWPWIFGLALIDTVFLVIGSLILVYGFDFNNADLFVGLFFLSAILLIPTIITGVAHDIQRDEGGVAA
jgi:hypothetical protein